VFKISGNLTGWKSSLKGLSKEKIFIFDAFFQLARIILSEAAAQETLKT
jgi:hypothetical protein